MDQEIQLHLKWVRMYQVVGNAGIVCNWCGISRPTLRKWVHRFEQYGLDGLKSKSCKPYRSPRLKVNPERTKWILKLRRVNNLGARRIQNELKRLYDFSISLSTIQKVLNAHEVEPLKHPLRKKHLHR